MTRRFSRLHLGLLVGGLLTATVVGCGGDDDNDDPTPAAGSGGTSGSGGKSGKGGGTSKGGSGVGGDGAAGENGTAGDGPVATGDIDDVIGAICDWEFGCCDAGEIRYRLNPTAMDAADCTADFVDQLHNDNSQDNPFIAGSAAGLLGVLGYNVDLTRVTVNATNVAACVEQWQARECNTEPDPDARCEAGADADPCALHMLFEPTVEDGGRCTLALTEGVSGANDIECVPGTTCVAANTAENPNEFDTCVTRGLTGDSCTADDDCDFDFFCDDAGECAEKAGAGEDCSYEDPDQPAAGEEAIKCKAGLSCHPVDLICLEACTLGAACAADTACPEGLACAPLTVQNDTDSFVLCAEPGNAGTDRCNTAADCVANRYCDGSTCQPDVTNGNPCTLTAQCQAGSYCDLSSLTPTCVSVLMPGDICTSTTPADGCGPAPAQCILSYGLLTGTCSAGPVDNGEDCSEDNDCESGLCEFAGAAAIEATCIAGAAEDADCDAVITTGTARRCGPGLYCNSDGVCVAQVGPGGSCEEPASTPNTALCTNGVCVDQWDEIMCTDAPVPVTSGGSNITCDGV